LFTLFFTISFCFRICIKFDSLGVYSVSLSLSHTSDIFTHTNIFNKKGDKLWFTKKRPQRHRGQLLSASSVSLVSAKVEESHVKVPFGFDLHTVERVYHFRAFGRQAKKDQLQKVTRIYDTHIYVMHYRCLLNGMFICIVEIVYAFFEHNMFLVFFSKHKNENENQF
jgi:hypothetical protein